MIPSHRLKQLKRRLRREVLSLRDAMPEPERVRRSRAIAERLLGLPEIADARTVLTFSSFGSEVDTGPIVDGLIAVGVDVALPRIEGDRLVPVGYRPGDGLTVARFGAREPSAGTVVPGDRIDVVVAPGVAFDRAGGRVGYGGGYYDRFLRGLSGRPFVVAIAFSLQVVEEVPTGHIDLPVDAIVTEHGVIRCRDAGPAVAGPS